MDSRAYEPYTLAGPPVTGTTTAMLKMKTKWPMGRWVAEGEPEFLGLLSNSM